MYAYILLEGYLSLGETRDSVVKSSGRGSRSTRWSTVTGTSEQLEHCYRYKLAAGVLLYKLAAGALLLVQASSWSTASGTS
jgi:hypothetical protein